MLLYHTDQCVHVFKGTVSLVESTLWIISAVNVLSPKINPLGSVPYFPALTS